MRCVESSVWYGATCDNIVLVCRSHDELDNNEYEYD